MIDQELKDLLAQLLATQAETQRELREATRELREVARELRESKGGTDHRPPEIRTKPDRRRSEVDRTFREMERKLAKVNDELYSHAEVVALHSMTKVLERRFRVNNIAAPYRVNKNGRVLEIDVFAFSSFGPSVAVAVKVVRNLLREESIEEILAILHDVPELMPQYHDKKLYGLLAAVEIPKELGARALAEGLYLARISGDTVKLQVPRNFVPRSFQSPPAET